MSIIKKIISILAMLGLTLGIAAIAIPANAAYPTNGTISRSEDTKLHKEIMEQGCVTPNEARAMANAKGEWVADPDYMLPFLWFNPSSGSSTQGTFLIFPMRKCAGDLISDYTKGRWRDSENENYWNKWYEWVNEAFPCLEPDGSDCLELESASKKSASVNAEAMKTAAKAVRR